MKLLIIEDDQELTQVLSQGLLQAGFETVHTSNRNGALHILVPQEEHDDIHGVILDWHLGEEDGIAIAQEIRRMSDVPIIMLTVKRDTQHVVEALDAGVDDYVCKPYDLSELVVRVSNLLNRNQTLRFRNVALHAKSVQMNIKNHTVTRYGEPVSLTKTEYKILMYLLLHQGQPISKEHLQHHIYGEKKKGVQHLINTHVLNVRKKIGSALEIQTIPQYGFIVH